MIDSALLVLEKAINRALQTDAHTLEHLQELNGKKIKIEIIDWRLHFFIVPTQKGIELRSNISGAPDTIIAGDLQSLFKIGIASDKHVAMKKHRIEFSGDAHIGIAMQKILSHLDIDWTEYLAKIMGDAPANLVSQGASKLLSLGKSMLSSVQRNLSDYIHHEAQLAPTAEELDDFYKKIAVLRDDVDRLDAQIKLLRKAHD